jgi:hypothetical protein
MASVSSDDGRSRSRREMRRTRAILFESYWKRSVSLCSSVLERAKNSFLGPIANHRLTVMNRFNQKEERAIGASSVVEHNDFGGRNFVLLYPT